MFLSFFLCPSFSLQFSRVLPKVFMAKNHQSHQSKVHSVSNLHSMNGVQIMSTCLFKLCLCLLSVSCFFHSTCPEVAMVPSLIHAHSFLIACQFLFTISETSLFKFIIRCCQRSSMPPDMDRKTHFPNYSNKQQSTHLEGRRVIMQLRSQTAWSQMPTSVFFLSMQDVTLQ